MVDPEEEALAAVQAAQNLVEKAMEGMLASTESLAASVLKAEREGGQMLSRQRSREVEEERHRVTREENSTLHALVNKLTGGHMSEIQGVKGREEAERKLEEVQATLSSAYGTIEDLKADVAAANHRVNAAVADEGTRKDAQCKLMLEAEARRAAAEKGLFSYLQTPLFFLLLLLLLLFLLQPLSLPLHYRCRRRWRQLQQSKAFGRWSLPVHAVGADDDVVCSPQLSSKTGL